MRAIRYGVAMSLDGYIAGPKGEYDWIIMDPEIDSPQIFSRFHYGRQSGSTVHRSASALHS